MLCVQHGAAPRGNAMLDQCRPHAVYCSRLPAVHVSMLGNYSLRAFHRIFFKKMRNCNSGIGGSVPTAAPPSASPTAPPVMSRKPGCLREGRAFNTRATPTRGRRLGCYSGGNCLLTGISPTNWDHASDVTRRAVLGTRPGELRTHGGCKFRRSIGGARQDDASGKKFPST